ncbi:MAG: ferric reductase-like transmembrane domain-containing protein [Nakamurella sp.]
MNTEILWYSSRATGAVSLVLFTAVMVLGIATAGRAGLAGLPRAGVLRLHRTLTFTALAFLTVHIFTAIVDGYVDLSYLDVFVPFGAGFDPIWIGLAAVAVDLLVAIGITSALRRHLTPRVWRWVHLSAYAMWPLALLHGFGVSGGDGRQSWMLILDTVCIAAIVVALAYRLRPDRHPDTVARRAAALVHPPTAMGRQG